jgi:hypothetical protein
MHQVTASQGLNYLVIDVDLEVIGGLVELRLPRKAEIVDIQRPQQNDVVVEEIVESSCGIVEEQGLFVVQLVSVLLAGAAIVAALPAADQADADVVACFADTLTVH